LIPGGIEYGVNMLVEFEPDSLWFETSFALAAYALRNRARTDYHTWIQPPGKIRDALSKFGLDVETLEREDLLRVADSYSSQTGLGIPGASQKWVSGSVKIADLSIMAAQLIKGHNEADKRRLHIDDNNSVLTEYNDEKAVIQFYRNRLIPECKARELAAFHSLAAGVHSDGFYKQFELFCDGIIDFKNQEKEGLIGQYVRVRMMRGQTPDSRWRKIDLLENGEVTIAD
jgi:KaiC/GvpD/RAD55 family RecA-like ATPase